MNNDALVAALGMHAVAAVQGYRRRVVAEAARRGLTLASAPLTDLVHPSTGACAATDPIDIRLVARIATNGDDRTRPMLLWNPAQGWSISATGGAPISYYAGPHSSPLQLVPNAKELLTWVSDELSGRATGHPAAPKNLELDDDPAAIKRLLDCIDSGGRTPLHRVSRPPVRTRSLGIRAQTSGATSSR
jgi:hypothetical protein